MEVKYNVNFRGFRNGDPLDISEPLFTFDDIVVLQRYSDFERKDIDLRTPLARIGDGDEYLFLNRPFVTAPMDTVTEAEMAIQMALYGGVGVIHNNFGTRSDPSYKKIELLVREVEKVKIYEAGFIENPITVAPSDKISKVYELMKKHNIKNIPVTEGGDSHSLLVGTISKNDYSMKSHSDLEVVERMTKIDDGLVCEYWDNLDPGHRLKAANDILLDSHRGSLPILNRDGTLKYLVSKTDIDKHEEFPCATKDENKRLVVLAAIGTHREDYKRMDALFAAGADGVVIDSADGDKKFVKNILKRGKKKYPDKIFIAGNISVYDAAVDLIKWGADALRVGMGSGSICETPANVGVSSPQGSCIRDCSRAVIDMQNKYGHIPVIADGGIRGGGDALKAFTLGGDTIMVGNLAAGTTEAPGDYRIIKGRKMRVYRGMGSAAAVLGGGSERYVGENFVSEGVEGVVPHKGPIHQVLRQIEEGLRRGMERCGARSITDLYSDKITVAKITPAAQREARPHDVTVIGD